ncbi:MAG: plasmid mobilization relaxosome protein MobC [Defluviitaleaceae bacterium]|nr:plasmid mobilization relaxosome protein MobC [Defluviitaleaceae bacterium]
MENRKRNIQIIFRVTAEEKAFIQEKIRSISMTNFREYARQMATKGYIVNVDCTEIKSLSAELQKIDVNIKKILRHVDNMDGTAYTADVESIRTTMAENWDMVRGLISRGVEVCE